jgi:hypothetical protein
MNQVSLLQKLAPLGVAAIGAIAATGIATAPAQAFVFKDGSTLNWGDTTNDFYDDVELIEGDTLQVIFNPNSPVISINEATGSFDPGFCDPLCLDNLATSPVVGNFEYKQSAFVNELRYVLQNDVVFDFDSRTLEDHFGNPTPGTLTWTAPAGTEFRAEKVGGSAELELCLDTCVTVPYFTFNGETFGAPPNSNGEVVQGFFQDTIQNRFQFDDSQSTGGGQYVAGGVVVKGAPEPASVLGLLTFAGLGLGLKRKQQA